MKTYIGAFVLLFGAVSVSFGIDDVKLKERLTGGVFELVAWENFDIKRLGATDEQLHRVLMDIYREAEEKWPTLIPRTPEWGENINMVTGVLGCLPLCGDIPVKDFLLDHAVSKEKEYHTRTAAICSYLRVASAKEAKNILLRFLVGEERTDLERLSIYSFARIAYDESDSPEKKAVIIAALIVAADKEEEKIRFMKADGILAERSTAYRKSKERLAMLERHSLEPPTANIYTDRDLKAALAESRKYKSHTSINTNLAVFAKHTFNLPQTNGLKNGMSALVPIDVANEEKPSASPPSRSLPLAVALSVGAGLIGAFALWRGIRKRK